MVRSCVSRSSIVNWPAQHALGVLLGLLLVDDLLEVLDQADDVAHAEDARREALGPERSRRSTDSPVPRNLIGTPVAAFTASAAPPRASPSSLVRIRPSSGRRSAKARATWTASRPISASQTSSTLAGAWRARTSSSSRISSSSTARRPAVS